MCGDVGVKFEVVGRVGRGGECKEWRVRGGGVWEGWSVGGVECGRGGELKQRYNYGKVSDEVEGFQL